MDLFFRINHGYTRISQTAQLQCLTQLVFADVMYTCQGLFILIFQRITTATITTRQEYLVLTAHVLSLSSKARTAFLRAHAHTSLHIAALHLTGKRLITAKIIITYRCLVKPPVLLDELLRLSLLALSTQLPYLLRHLGHLLLYLRTHHRRTATPGKTLNLLNSVLNLMVQYTIHILQLISMNGNGIRLRIIITSRRHVTSHSICHNTRLLQLRISLKQFRSINHISKLAIIPKHVLIKTLHNMPVNIHRLLYLSIRHLITPLTVSTTFPASSQLDSLRVLLLSLHLASHTQVVKSRAHLIGMVETFRTLLANKLFTNFVVILKKLTATVGFLNTIQ